MKTALKYVAVFGLGFLWGFIVFKGEVPASPSILNTTSPTEKLASSSLEITLPKGETYLVKRAIDGDTIELANGEKVRYVGIDTPESVDPRKPVQCFGSEASKKNSELVVGKSVRLVKDVSDRDHYGRLLRFVYVENVFINLELVKQGYAHAYDYPPDISKSAELHAAEKEAREAKRGLWGSCSSSTSPTPVAAPADAPAGCTIKGNISSSGKKIYHVSGCGSYAKTSIDTARGERWFCSEKEAQDAGWRKAGNC